VWSTWLQSYDGSPATHAHIDHTAVREKVGMMEGGQPYTVIATRHHPGCSHVCSGLNMEMDFGEEAIRVPVPVGLWHRSPALRPISTLNVIGLFR
jgi:hypothetical protein